MPDSLYCKVYVNDAGGTLDGAALKAIVSAATGARFERRALRAGGLLVEVFEHRLPLATTDPARDFLAWPVVLEVEPEHAGLSKPDFVAALAAWLNTLNSNGLRTVASSDFEDELAEAQQRSGAR